MSTDKNADQSKKSAGQGKEEELLKNTADDIKDSGTAITSLPGKDDMALHETEGERRFKEGMANNSDTGEGNPA